jgi:hypothetical protein
VGLAYMVSQGNITATIVWFAITTGATAGLRYYKEKKNDCIAADEYTDGSWKRKQMLAQKVIQIAL